MWYLLYTCYFSWCIRLLQWHVSALKNIQYMLLWSLLFSCGLCLAWDLCVICMSIQSKYLSWRTHASLRNIFHISMRWLSCPLMSRKDMMFKFNETDICFALLLLLALNICIFVWHIHTYIHTYIHACLEDTSKKGEWF